MKPTKPTFPFQSLPIMNYIAEKLIEEGRRVKVLQGTIGYWSIGGICMTKLYIEEKTGRFPWNRRCLVDNLPFFPERIRYNAKDQALVDIINQSKKEFPNLETWEFYN